VIADLRVQPWWTEADDAELDLLTAELVRVVFIHREHCATCRGERGVLYCDGIGEAIAAVLDWRDGRVLRSKAAWLRAREDEVAIARHELVSTRGGLF
jgi:hypothetical protein